MEKYYDWSANLEELTTLARTHTIAELAEMYGRDKGTMRETCNRYGISWKLSSGVWKWTEAQMSALREYAPEHTIREVSQKFSISEPRAYQLCSRHNISFKRNPSVNKPEDFDKLYKVDAQTDCWIWQGSLNRDGYGQWSCARKHWLAHRFAWTYFTGEEIPLGYEIDHKCRNKACVAVHHLECVTKSVNVKRVTMRWTALREAAWLAVNDPTETTLANLKKALLT